MSIFTIVRKNGGTIAWEDSQVAYIIDKYVNSGFPISELAAEFGCSTQAIRNLLRQNHIELRGSKAVYPRNSSYFKNIDTPEKAYWLGFLYASSEISHGKVLIQFADYTHAVSFKKAIGAINHKVTERQDLKSQKLIYTMKLGDKIIAQDLINWGCVPNRSCIPNIPRLFTSQFIRGYFDGKGGLYYSNAVHTVQISFYGTKDFLEDVKKELRVDVSLAKLNDILYQLQISGRRQVIRILDYMYSGSTDATCLDRKYILYVKCLEWARSH